MNLRRVIVAGAIGFVLWFLAVSVWGATPVLSPKAREFRQSLRVVTSPPPEPQAVPLPQKVLAWDASPTTNVVSYRLYSGSGTRAYTNEIDAGTALSWPLSGVPLAYGSNFFAVTAVNTNKLESDYSNETNLFRARPPTRLLLQWGTNTLLTFSNAPPATNQWYRVRAGQLQSAQRITGPWGNVQSVGAGPVRLQWERQ